MQLHFVYYCHVESQSPFFYITYHTHRLSCLFRTYVVRKLCSYWSAIHFKVLLYDKVNDKTQFYYFQAIAWMLFQSTTAGRWALYVPALRLSLSLCVFFWWWQSTTWNAISSTMKCSYVTQWKIRCRFFIFLIVLKINNVFA